MERGGYVCGCGLGGGGGGGGRGGQRISCVGIEGVNLWLALAIAVPDDAVKGEDLAPVACLVGEKGYLGGRDSEVGKLASCLFLSALETAALCVGSAAGGGCWWWFGG